MLQIALATMVLLACSSSKDEPGEVATTKPIEAETKPASLFLGSSCLDVLSAFDAQGLLEVGGQMAVRCHKDKWSTEHTDCFAAAKTGDAITVCMQVVDDKVPPKGMDFVATVEGRKKFAGVLASQMSAKVTAAGKMATELTFTFDFAYCTEQTLEFMMLSLETRSRYGGFSKVICKSGTDIFERKL